MMLIAGVLGTAALPAFAEVPAPYNVAAGQVVTVTVRIITNGNLNLATLDFRSKGSPRSGPGITVIKTHSTTAAKP